MDEITRAFMLFAGTLAAVSGISLMEEGSVFSYLFIIGSFVIYLAREYVI